MPEHVIISIYGKSGAGKSNLAKELVTMLGEDTAARIPTDYFLLPVESGDSSFRYDWPLLEQGISGNSHEIKIPNYDFERLVKLPGTIKIVAKKPILIVDAMLPYPKANLTILLEITETLRLNRIQDRDIRWQTSVANRLNLLQATEANMFDFSADAILNGQDSLAENAKKIIRILSNINL